MKKGEIKHHVLSLASFVFGARSVDRLILRRNFLKFRRTGIIFIHVPKCAGTSISKSLYNGSLGHRTAKEMRDFSPKEFMQLKKFAIIREPVQRAYSAWAYARSGGSKTGWATPYPDYQLPEFSTFERFATEWLPSRQIESLDYVFQSQHSFLVDEVGQMLVDDIIPLEHLDNAWMRIIASCKPSHHKLQNLNDNRSDSLRGEPYSSLVYESLEDVYSEDFELYRYYFEKTETKL